MATRDGNRSSRPGGRVEILRPAGQAGETPVKFSLLATKKHLSTNRNIQLYFIMRKIFYKKKTVLTNTPFENIC